MLFFSVRYTMEDTLNNRENANVQDIDDWSKFMNILGIEKNAWDIVTEDMVGKELDNVHMWETFYDFYSKLVGFKYRKNDVRKDFDGIIWSRRFTCSREGFRRKQLVQLKDHKRETRAETRCGCKANLRVNKNRARNKWIVKEFIPTHNHDCASLEQIRFLRSNLKVTDDVVAKCTSTKRVGMKTCHIMDFIALEVRRHDNLQFHEKDSYNKLLGIRRAEEKDTTVIDSDGALGYIQCLARNHGGDFHCVYSVDEENRLCNIFWADGKSRRDYATFGDVLAFDTTFRTNKYNKPLLLLIGVNHHVRTTVFGIALLCDETIDSLVWVLQMFLEGMNNKKPKVVLTDGDDAMQNAIAQLLPEATHRLYGWHLLENVGKNVRDINFSRDFKQIMYEFYSENEFLERWEALTHAYELENNDWAKKMFLKKDSWAETYLHGNFFGGTHTTQQCESINADIRPLLDRTNSLTEFVACIDFALNKLRQKEMQDDFYNQHTPPSLPEGDILKPYYEQAASIFTQRMYEKVVKEIKLQNAYSVRSMEDINDCRHYSLTKFPEGDVPYTVRFWKLDGHLDCTCLLFETDGYPCCHIFSVMKFLNLMSIPNSLIMRRWTINAKSPLHQHPPPYNEVPIEIMEMARFGSLNSDFNHLAYYATKVEDYYNEARTEITRLTLKFKALMESQPNKTVSHNSKLSEDDPSFNILRDSLVVRNKEIGNQPQQRDTMDIDEGTNDSRRKCSLCKGYGHNKQTCSLKKGKGRNNETPTQDTNTTPTESQASTENHNSSGAPHHPLSKSQYAAYSTSMPPHNSYANASTRHDNYMHCHPTTLRHQGPTP